MLIDTDVETATEYTATFAPVETCVTVRGENSCTSGSANQSHRGKWERWVEVPIEFSAEPNAISYRDMIDRVAGGNLICGIVSAENGTMVGARRTAAPSNKRWVVRVHPETGAKDIILTIHRNGNPNAACDTRKITEFGETNMRLAASVTHTITRPPQITMADVTVSEDLRTLQCTRTHHDPVLDGDGNPVVDEDNKPVTTPRIENFERHNFPSHFVLTAILDKPAKNGLTLDFDRAGRVGRGRALRLLPLTGSIWNVTGRDRCGGPPSRVQERSLKGEQLHTYREGRHNGGSNHHGATR